MQIIIRGGMLVDPASKTMQTKDVLIKDGLIKEIGTGLNATEALEIDAQGKLVAPGLVDMHVHLREPGEEDKETVETGTKAALRGGFTAVAAMPNTVPVAETPGVISQILEKAQSAGYARVYPVGALTKEGRELTEMGDLYAAGAIAFSDDGKPVMDAGLMRRAMDYARMFDVPVISHCEDLTLSEHGVMHEGAISTSLGLRGMPAVAEEIMVARDLMLAELTCCRLHIAHVSTAGAVELVRAAKAKGVKVTAEATPHHFTLTEKAVGSYNTLTKVNPPLRTEEDVAALREGLADGTIDVIATDHAPHALHDKELEYDQAAFGIVGLETAVGLVFTELVAKGILDIPTAIAKLSLNPSQILNLDVGVIKVGNRADITIIDPEASEVVKPEQFVSKSKNTPFVGYKLQGLPVTTILGGKVYNRADW